MIRRLRNLALSNSFVRRRWAMKRSWDFELRYRRWSEQYEKMAVGCGLSYSREATRAAVRARIESRHLPARSLGDIHSVAFTLTRNWGIGLAQEMEELGRATVFDWEKHGYRESDPDLQSRLPELNRLMLDFLRKTHTEHPIDWILFTCSGNLVLNATLRRIRDELCIPTVQQWLDCKQNFEHGMGPHGQDLGQRDIAGEFDLIWTSSRATCNWYLAVGARPLFLPEGFSPKLTPRVEAKKAYDVGFLGACYGLRPDYIGALRDAGINVAVRGYGWPGADAGSLPLDQMGQFVGQCKVNLGMGGVGYSTELTTLKGRDFEVPGAGGAYLTTFNPDLTDSFDIGREIVCYHSVDEMVELARRLVRDDAWRETIAERAYQRSMREHRWLHRYMTILELLGIVQRTDKEKASETAHA